MTSHHTPLLLRPLVICGDKPMYEPALKSYKTIAKKHITIGFERFLRWKGNRQTHKQPYPSVRRSWVK